MQYGTYDKEATQDVYDKVLDEFFEEYSEQLDEVDQDDRPKLQVTEDWLQVGRDYEQNEITFYRRKLRAYDSRVFRTRVRDQLRKFYGVR